MRPRQSVQLLTSLGFAGLEAEAYLALLQDSPMTGYRVAQALSKPVANTYKALEALHAKGAIVVEEGQKRVCRAVPPEELLDHMERRFLERRKRAQKALSGLRRPARDERIYTLGSRAQVLERARKMLGRAKEVALVDSFPEPLAELRADLEAATKRGLKVAIKAYAPTQIKGAAVLQEQRGQELRERWPGQWLNLVCDGRETLMSLLGPDSVLQAIWSGSTYLSWIYHSALFAEIALAGAEQKLEAGASSKEVREFLKGFDGYLSREAAGYRVLRRRFGRASRP